MWQKYGKVEVFSMENGILGCIFFDSMIMGDRVLSWGFYGNTQNSLSPGEPRRPSLPFVSVSPPWNYPAYPCLLRSVYIYPQSILTISSSVVHDFQVQAAIMRGLPLSLWRTTKHNFPWYFPSSFPLTLLLLFPLGLGVSETLPLAFLSFDRLPFLGQNYSDSSYMRGTFNMSNFTNEVVASLDENYKYLFYVHGWKYVSKSTTEILNRISNKKISS